MVFKYARMNTPVAYGDMSASAEEMYARANENLIIDGSHEYRDAYDFELSKFPDEDTQVIHCFNLFSIQVDDERKNEPRQNLDDIFQDRVQNSAIDGDWESEIGDAEYFSHILDSWTEIPLGHVDMD